MGVKERQKPVQARQGKSSLRAGGRWANRNELRLAIIHGIARTYYHRPWQRRPGTRTMVESAR